VGPFQERHSRTLLTALAGARILSSVFGMVHQHQILKDVSANTFKMEQLEVGAQAQVATISHLASRANVLDSELQMRARQFELLSRVLSSLEAKIWARHFIEDFYRSLEAPLIELQYQLPQETEVFEAIVLGLQHEKPSEYVFSQTAYDMVKGLVPSLILTVPLTELKATYEPLMQTSFRVMVRIPASAQKPYSIVKIFAIPDVNKGLVPDIWDTLIALLPDKTKYMPFMALQAVLCMMKGCQAPSSEKSTSFSQCRVAQLVGAPIDDCNWVSFHSSYYIQRFNNGLLFDSKVMLLQQ